MNLTYDRAANALRFTASLGMKGFIRMEAAQPLFPNDPYGLKGERYRRLVADWFPNKILDAGRNVMATRGDWMNVGQIGNGSTPPLASNTALEQWVAGTTTIVADQWGTQASAPYYGWRRKTWRFPVGAATGNNQEAGVGWGTSGSTLTSRALIVDEFGDPTSATVLSTEFLDLTYELRYYPPASDVLGTVTLDKVYDTTIRAAEVTSSDAWARYIGTQIRHLDTASPDKRWRGYDDVLGTVTQTPSGTTAAHSGTISTNTYVNNSYKIHMVVSEDTAGWVFAPPGLRSIRICTSAGNYQMQMDAQSDGSAVPKGANLMSLEFDLAWEETTP